MKLYDTQRAPNPRRVRWLMAEKGIEDIEIVQVDLLAGQHRTAEYRDKVGAPHVPALELDDGTCISESLAICRYLEALLSRAEPVRPRREGAGGHRDVDPPGGDVPVHADDADGAPHPSGAGGAGGAQAGGGGLQPRQRASAT